MKGIEDAQLIKESRLATVNLVKNYMQQNAAAVMEYTLGSAKWLPWMEQSRCCEFAVESINDEACHSYPIARHVEIDSSKDERCEAHRIRCILQNEETGVCCVHHH